MKQFSRCLSVFISALIISIFFTSCGSNDSEKLQDEAFIGDEEDAIAFLDDDLNQIFQMNMKGAVSEITSFSERTETPFLDDKE